MTKEEKLEMLQGLTGKELTQRFLNPLFERMEFKNVRYTHSILEFGKDIVYCEDDRYGQRIYTGVLVNRIKITTSNVDPIFRQTHQAFYEPFTNVTDGKKRDLDRFVVLTSNEFTEEAKDSMYASLRGVKLDKLITCVDGNMLVDLLDKYMPFTFWDEYDYFNKYLNAMKIALEAIEDISTINRLEPVPLEEIYVPLRLVEPAAMKERVIHPEEERKLMKGKIYDAERAVRDFDRLVIVGVPGSGKTTLLRHLALKSCEENIERQERVYVPILITLRELLESKKQLREYLDDVFKKPQFPKAESFIEKYLNDGKCRLLLDGFDELATRESQEEAAKQIQRFIEKYRKNKIVVTSRSAGYHDELEGFTKLELMEFNDAQTEQFINSWFGKTKPGNAKAMSDAIKQNEQIKTLARNPLMIAIIATVYEWDKKLPQNRAALYNRCVEVLLSKWDVQQGTINIYPLDKKEVILKKLALYAHSNNKTVLSEKEVTKVIDEHLVRLQMKEKDIKPFLDEIWKRSYLLRQISTDSYDFLHLSFQEYFTALELKDQADGISTIIEHLHEHWWEEPALLYAGISKDASALIKKIESEAPEDIFYSNLMLFGKCIADAEFTEPSLREKIINDLWSLYQEAVRLRRIRPLWERAINVLSLIKPASIIDLLIRNLKDEGSGVRAHAASALGLIGSEKTIEPLIYALADMDSVVRRNVAFALGRIGGEKTVEPLIYALVDMDSDVRVSAASALGSIGSEKAIGPLINALADKER